MKVLFIADPGVVGGATRSLVELVTTLHEKYRVECVVCTSESKELCQELQKYGIKSILSGHEAVMDVIPNIPLWNRIKALIKFLKYKLSIEPAIKQIESKVDVNSFDLIHTNSARNDIGCILASKYGIPHIVHFREFGQEDFDCWTFRFRYTSFLNRYTTRFIAISNAVKRSWVKKGIKENKIYVIYNGVDSKSIKPSNCNDMLNSKVLKLVIVGGVYPTKGQYQIIEAIGNLPQKIRENVTLDVIGWSSEKYINKLKKRVYELGLTKQVSFLGARDDIYELLQNYHVGLTCSKSEGFGRVTAEYMHAGLGVIASDTGANPELIQDGINGLLYRWNDINDLERQITKYYYKRELLGLCSKEGVKFAQANFTQDINAEKIYDNYKDLLKTTQEIKLGIRDLIEHTP